MKFALDENDDRQEPTFSLADIKKWLGKQNKPDPNLKNEDIETPAVEIPRDEKEVFKNKLRKKRSTKQKKD